MTITNERVFELIHAFGAEPGGWPEDEREAAMALLAAEPDTFAAALEDARALDALLLNESLPEPSLALTDAILAAAPQAKAPQRKSATGGLWSMLFPQGARWPAGAALASLMMGLVGGYAYASTGAGYDQVEDAYYAAFGYDATEAWMSLE